MYTALSGPQGTFPLLPNMAAAQEAAALGQFRRFRAEKPG